VDTNQQYVGVKTVAIPPKLNPRRRNRGEAMVLSTNMPEVNYLRNEPYHDPVHEVIQLRDYGWLHPALHFGARRRADTPRRASRDDPNEYMGSGSPYCATPLEPRGYKSRWERALDRELRARPKSAPAHARHPLEERCDTLWDRAMAQVSKTDDSRATSAVQQLGPSTAALGGKDGKLTHPASPYSGSTDVPPSPASSDGGLEDDAADETAAKKTAQQAAFASKTGEENAAFLRAAHETPDTAEAAEDALAGKGENVTAVAQAAQEQPVGAKAAEEAAAAAKAAAEEAAARRAAEEAVALAQKAEKEAAAERAAQQAAAAAKTEAEEEATRRAAAAVAQAAEEKATAERVAQEVMAAQEAAAKAAATKAAEEQAAAKIAEERAAAAKVAEAVAAASKAEDEFEAVWAKMASEPAAKSTKAAEEFVATKATTDASSMATSATTQPAVSDEYEEDFDEEESEDPSTPAMFFPTSSLPIVKVVPPSEA